MDDGKGKTCANSQLIEASLAMCQDECLNYENCKGISFRPSSDCFLCDSVILSGIDSPGFTSYKKPE